MKIQVTKTVTVEEELSRQEMFNRAFYGLRSQGFERAVNEAGACQYRQGDRRCAWGWVDPEGTIGQYGNITDLINKKTGLARFLTGAELPSTANFGSDYKFAVDLQRCHDNARDPLDMKARLRMFAEIYNLTVPYRDYADNGPFKAYLDTSAKPASGLITNDIAGDEFPF